MTFLFDTICDDIIGEITKYIVWTKDGWWNSTLGVRAHLGTRAAGPPALEVFATANDYASLLGAAAASQCAAAHALIQ